MDPVTISALIMGGSTLAQGLSSLFGGAAARRVAAEQSRFGRGIINQGMGVMRQANQELNDFNPWQAAAATARMQGFGFNRLEADRQTGGNAGYLRSLANRRFNTQAQGSIYNTGMIGMGEKARMRAGIGASMGQLGAGIYSEGQQGRLGGIGMQTQGMSNMFGGAADFGAAMFGQSWAARTPMPQQTMPSFNTSWRPSADMMPKLNSVQPNMNAFSPVGPPTRNEYMGMQPVPLRPFDIG